MIDEEAFDARMRERAAKIILRNMLTLQAAHKKKLSIANPRPFLNSSKPGQFPKARTFNLRDCVVTEPASLATISQTLLGRTGVLLNAKYGEILKAKGWKGIEDTHEELKAAGAYR